MADFRYLVQRAFAVPPHVAAWKTVKWVTREMASLAAGEARKFADPYAKPESCGPLQGFLPKFEADTTARLADIDLTALISKDLDHRYDLLGSGPVPACYSGYPDGPDISRLPPGARRRAQRIRQVVSTEYTPIDWFRDMRSGYRWPEKGSGAKKVAPTPGADIKWPWELGRLQHFPRLALACAVKVPPELARNPLTELNDQLADFRSAAPPGHGVAWACTMDVAIRTANIALAWSILDAGNVPIEAETATLWSEVLHEHADFISKNLEWVPDLRGNHYLCDLAGLLLAASILPESAERSRYLDLAVAELDAETDLQFQADGSNFEGSICYHRLSTETLAWSTLVLHRVAQESSAPDAFHHCLATMRKSLSKAANFSASVTGPDGMVPQIGDNDSGRFVEFRPDLPDTDHRRLVHLARLAAGEPCADMPEGKDPALVLADVMAGVGTTGPLPDTPTVSRFDDFGLYIRRWDGIALTFRCGSVGQRGNGGHDHNDQLSITVATTDGILIADPGTGTYTADPDRRNHFRAASSHACFSVIGREPNAWHDGLYGLFSLKSAQGSSIEICDESAFSGSHGCYVTPCTRHIQFGASGFHVTDGLHLHASKRLCLPLGPAVKAELDGSTARLTLGARSFTAILGGGLEWKTVPGAYSAAYGVTVDAIWLQVDTDSTGISWSLSWGDAGQ